MSVSLEDQRRALLEQIEASRAVYRRMLTGESPAGGTRRSWTVRQPAAGTGSIAGPAVVTGPLPGRTLSGGRSKAVQWAMDHPLWVAGGVALLVLLLPRAVEARQQRARHAKRQAALDTSKAYLQPERRRQSGQGSGAGRALLTAALLLLRDPARLQAAGRLAGSAWRWVQSRRRH